MKSNFFTVEVPVPVPTVAVGQHADYANSDIVFDWHAFDIPRGPAKLMSITMEVRSAGDAGASVQKPALELFFANDIVTAGGTQLAPTSLGAVNGAVSATSGPKTNIIGAVELATTGYSTDIDGTSIWTSGRAEGNDTPLHMVLQGLPSTGTTIGTDRLYIAAVLDGSTTLDLESLTRINNGTLDGSVFTVNGTDPRLFLAPGDFITATTTADTSVAKDLGVIKSMADANTITLETTTENAIVNDDFIYNKFPIKFYFHFSK